MSKPSQEFLDLKFHDGQYGPSTNVCKVERRPTKHSYGKSALLVGRVDEYRYLGDGDYMDNYSLLWVEENAEGGGMIYSTPCTQEEWTNAKEHPQCDPDFFLLGQVLYQKVLEAEKEAQAEEEYKKAKEANSYPNKGDLALTFTNPGQLGRVRWSGLSGGDPWGRNRQERVGLAPTVGPVTQHDLASFFCPRAATITVPKDLEGVLEEGDSGASPLADALAALFDGEINLHRTEAVDLLSGALCSPAKVARLRLYGMEIQRARREYALYSGTPAKDLPENPATGKRWVKKHLLDSIKELQKNLVLSTKALAKTEE